MPKVWLQENRRHGGLRAWATELPALFTCQLCFSILSGAFGLWYHHGMPNCQDGELLPGESKQDVNAKIYHYEIAYKSSVAFFLKGNNRQDLGKC